MSVVQTDQRADCGGNGIPMCWMALLSWASRVKLRWRRMDGLEGIRECSKRKGDVKQSRSDGTVFVVMMDER